MDLARRLQGRKIAFSWRQPLELAIAVPMWLHGCVWFEFYCLPAWL
jgi:hypothetical protein